MSNDGWEKAISHFYGKFASLSDGSVMKVDCNNHLRNKQMMLNIMFGREIKKIEHLWFSLQPSRLIALVAGLSVLILSFNFFLSLTYSLTASFNCHLSLFRIRLISKWWQLTDSGGTFCDIEIGCALPSRLHRVVCILCSLQSLFIATSCKNDFLKEIQVFSLSREMLPEKLSHTWKNWVAFASYVLCNVSLKLPVITCMIWMFFRARGPERPKKLVILPWIV